MRIFRDTGDIFTDAEIYQHEMQQWFEKKSKTKDETVEFILLRTVEDDPTFTLREMCLLLQAFGICISQSALHYFWKRKNYTFKRICGVAKEARIDECERFWELYYMLVSNIDQCLWGDESDRNDKTVNRNFGRAPRSVKSVSLAECFVIVLRYFTVIHYQL